MLLGCMYYGTMEKSRVCRLFESVFFAYMISNNTRQAAEIRRIPYST